jgi:hypothetical protein
MSAFISRLLVLFYIIFIPLYFGLYAAAMVSSYPMQAALWIEGGATDLGSAAFFALLALWFFPLLFSFIKYLFAGDSSDLGKVLVICAVLSAYPIIGAIQAHMWEQKFPVQVLYIKWGQVGFFGLFLIAILVIPTVGIIINTVHEIHTLTSSKEAERKNRAELSARFRVNSDEISQLLAGLIAHDIRVNSWFRKSDELIASQYLPRHLGLLSKVRLPVDAYLSFVERAVGKDNMLNDAAFIELDRHIQSLSETGGMEQHFRWLEAIARHSLQDKSFSLYPSSRYNSEKISLSEALVEFRLGEFATPDEYLEFTKARVGYVGYVEKQPFEKDLEMMSHPVLVKMFELGGAHRSRALQIVRRSRNAVKAETPNAILPDTGISAAPTPPLVAPIDLVMISRGGQIILRDIKLQNLSTMVMQGQVLTTDHYWCSGMAGWSLVSSYRCADASLRVPEEGVNWGDVLKDFFLSWLLYVLGGTLIAGLIGYGNGGMSGVGSAIGGFLGFIILVRPVTFLFRTLFRLATGKRGMDLYR